MQVRHMLLCTVQSASKYIRIIIFRKELENKSLKNSDASLLVMQLVTSLATKMKRGKRTNFVNELVELVNHNFPFRHKFV